VIVLLLGEFVRLECFLRSAINLALIEMQLAGIHQHRSRSAMMLMVRIDLTGAMELIERFSAELDIARVACTARFCVFSASLHSACPQVNPLPELQRDEPLYVCRVH
jgi:hypothetical protein